MNDESYFPRSRRTIRHRPGKGGQPVQVGRHVVSEHGGVGRSSLPMGLNDTERLVARVLDDEFVSAKEIAGFAGVSVEECRRALATLRSLGLADAERRGNNHVWKRA